jgi:MinD-like ATPase involved in chromosome partitioning or flagellar assembly
MAPVNTLWLSAKVTLVDRTGTRVRADSLEAATAKITGYSHQSAPLLALAEAHASGPGFTSGAWRLAEGQLAPAPGDGVPDYRLEYSDFHLTDAEGQRLSPVTMDNLPTIGQNMATRSGQQITIDTRLPGVRTHRYDPAAAPSTADAEPVEPSVENPGTDSLAGTVEPVAPAPAAADPRSPASAAEAFVTRTQSRRDALSPAHTGWRGALNSALGLRLVPGAGEQRTRALNATVQKGLPGHRTAVVVNIKGGASKTTATYLLAATLGRVRGGMVLAWDNNENAGNLGDRAIPAAHSHTALDLLEHIEDFTTPEHADKLAGYIRPQGENKFHVLASQNEAGTKEVINATAFRTMHAALRQFYQLAIVDTGNASTAPTWQAAVDVADVLVVAISNKEDAARRAFTTIDALRAEGYGEKLANGVAIITQPRTASTQRLAEIQNSLTGLVRSVVVVPYDRTLDDGGEIIWEALAPRTRQAYLQATAAVVEGM